MKDSIRLLKEVCWKKKIICCGTSLDQELRCLVKLYYTEPKEKSNVRFSVCVSPCH